MMERGGPLVPAFEYRNAPFPIRDDLPAAFRRAWGWIAAPGSWWRGAERVAIAEEARRAVTCALCIERKDALSPHAVDGEHDHAGVLSEAAVDAVHRLVTDAARLSRAWREKGAAAGLPDGHYVELLGVVVAMMSIDSFHRALGIPLEPLPAAIPGEPSHYRPDSVRDGTGWVPMIPEGKAKGNEAELFPRPVAPNVLRAMSLVPDCVRSLRDLSKAMYVPIEQVGDVTADPGRAISRAQIELLAGRVSAVNECFY